MDDLEQALAQRLDAAMTRLQKMASTSLPVGARVNGEQEYALAYQALVRAGLRPQIRSKYRSV